MDTSRISVEGAAAPRDAEIAHVDVVPVRGKPLGAVLRRQIGVRADRAAELAF